MFFLRYAKDHLDQEETYSHARKLVKILLKQHDVFQKELFNPELELGLDEFIIEINKDKYFDLIYDINRIIEKGKIC